MDQPRAGTLRTAYLLLANWRCCHRGLLVPRLGRGRRRGLGILLVEPRIQCGKTGLLRIVNTPLIFCGANANARNRLCHGLGAPLCRSTHCQSNRCAHLHRCRQVAGRVQLSRRMHVIAFISYGRLSHDSRGRGYICATRWTSCFGVNSRIPQVIGPAWFGTAVAFPPCA